MSAKQTLAVTAAALLGAALIATTWIPDDSDQHSAKEFTSRLDVLTERVTALEKSAARVEAERLEAGIRKPPAAFAEETDPADPVQEPGEEPMDLVATVDDLVSPDLDDREKAAIWMELREAGLIDATRNEFERRAEATPFDSMAQTELAWSYFQTMLTVANGPEKGRWGAKGSQALLRALEMDDRNWDARYSLAQHYYYADMRGDAVRELRMLVDQQGARRPEARHARAYLLLGNLYMDRGKSAEAKQVWRAGSAIFSQDSTLRDRLQEFE